MVNSKNISAVKDNKGFDSEGHLWVHGKRWDSEESYLQDVLDDVTSHLDEEGRELVVRACKFVADKHRGQKRLSGDEYIVHLVEVVKILAQYHLDSKTLAVAFMHDLIEEKTTATIEEVRELFGKEIAALVDGVTNLTGLFSRQERIVSHGAVGGRSAQEGAAETLRKIFLAIARDLRVVLVKVADRLHNLRTLDYVTDEVKLSIARETLDIFAPIVSRLGIWEFKAELEDLAFKYAYPDKYANLIVQVEENRQRRYSIMMECVETIKQKLKEAGIEAQLEQRSKHLYSIFRKLERQHKSLDEIYDLQAIRVIVPTVEDCYAVFGMVHSMWQPMNDRIKDYIARPKSNNYRSLHTTVFGPQNQLLEIQIRTFEMHHYNECGVAAHFAYKEGRKAFIKGSSDNLFRECYPWIRALFDWKSEAQDDREFNEHLKVDVLDKDIFVFTPKGDVVDLPVGATPLDFAYMVHTEVGHRCVGARVNGKMVALNYVLQNADVVAIQTAKVDNPSRDWLRICTTHQAQSKIRAWFKRERREENILRGRDILRKEAARNREEELANDEALLQQASDLLKFSSIDDMLASVGYGETSIASLWGRMKACIADKKDIEDVPSTTVIASKAQARMGKDVYIEGLDNLLTKMAHCCNPAPGDEIVGYISLGKGLTVHRVNCANAKRLKAEHPQRLVKAYWSDNVQKGKYSIKLNVVANDRPNLLSDVISMLNEGHIGVRSCQAFSQNNQAVIVLTVEVTGTMQINEIVPK